MRSLCSNPPHPAPKHFSQLTRAPFSQDSSAERGHAFRRTRPLRARRTSTTIYNWGPRVAETLRRAVVASRMLWSDGAGSMLVASLAPFTAKARVLERDGVFAWGLDCQQVRTE